ncbi:ABC transporter ATP-binding protein [Massilia sp. CF038]|uniref:ABC transporter ATP-binding protein n=1 Tax=Massilia sp. CF038 TaxID=1881045 RepID=UPI0009245B29|nr:ABC transporter ATP-binding protein [Massilia sp. CF038]SHH10957.1 ABC-2 type transport system ATP-binding protein [Massilia sp. CF038]
MDSLAVQLRAVCKRYPHFALDQVDLSVAKGSVMGFLGANGAGKSTTIRILMGLNHQSSGSVQVLGHAMPSQQALAKQEIGFVSEDLRLYGSASLQWHMDLVASVYPRWDATYSKALLGRFDLKAEQKIKGLSHGQRVKAALLLALARRPRLLVLDEPTTGLDPVARHEVLAELMHAMVDEERTVLFSSHNTRDVEQIADAITFIDRGRIIDADDKENYLERWRRIQLDLPPGRILPAMPGTVSLVGEGRSRILTTSNFTDEITGTCQAAGASIHAVQSMSLEEIFVNTVMGRRGEAAA